MGFHCALAGDCSCATRGQGAHRSLASAHKCQHCRKKFCSTECVQRHLRGRLPDGRPLGTARRACSSSAAQEDAAAAAHKRSVAVASLDLGALPSRDLGKVSATHAEVPQPSGKADMRFLHEQHERSRVLQGLDQDIEEAQEQLQHIQQQVQQARAEHEKILEDCQVLDQGLQDLLERQQQQQQHQQHVLVTAIQHGVLAGDSSDDEEGLDEVVERDTGVATTPVDDSAADADSAPGPGPSSQLMALIQALPGNYRWAGARLCLP